MNRKIGVLALQGAFHKHILMLQGIGADTAEIRNPEELDDLDGLIIPGGESTVMGKLMTRYSLAEPIIQKYNNGMGIYGTCAGMILIASRIEEMEQPVLSLMDITVRRNAYGRQKESFEAAIDIKLNGESPFNGIFIRAPRITGWGSKVEILAEYEDVPVLLRQDRLLASSFHPELTGDDRIHRYFLNMLV